MRPREFISRSIDLFDFELEGYPTPENLNSAGLIINLMDGLSTTVNGHVFQLESRKCLGHIVLRATAMIPETKLKFGASVCFTLRYSDYSNALEHHDTDEQYIYETWQMPEHWTKTEEDQSILQLMEVLTFLKLKTNDNITRRI